MKKTVFISGIIAGLISTSLYIGLMILGKANEMDFENGIFYGYTLMILGFAFIFVGTKITRDKYNGGVISFWKAFRVGLYITLIAAAVYVTVWLIDFYFFIPDFAEKYGAYMLKNLRASGASEAEITKQTAEMARFAVMIKNPFFNIMLTSSEILPVGIIISLLSAVILKRKTAPGLASTI